jgi:cbb3-type cytochrome oxidase subunit 1
VALRRRSKEIFQMIHPLANRFFATAAILALCGMAWGMVMSATHDHTLGPAHGHLNLVGFVAMAVFGSYYALAPAAAESGLARLHYWLALGAVVVFAPGIALAIEGVTEALALLGTLLVIASMALFLFIVLTRGGRQPA